MVAFGAIIEDIRYIFIVWGIEGSLGVYQYLYAMSPYFYGNELLVQVTVHPFGIAYRGRRGGMVYFPGGSTPIVSI